MRPRELILGKEKNCLYEIRPVHSTVGRSALSHSLYLSHCFHFIKLYLVYYNFHCFCLAINVVLLLIFEILSVHFGKKFAGTRMIPHSLCLAHFLANLCGRKLCGSGSLNVCRPSSYGVSSENTLKPSMCNKSLEELSIQIFI